ncbi:MAG: MarR family transcriptional regulator [Anaerolineae bacterium]|jgi:DNA-binding MarR family transcriptional regulator
MEETYELIKEVFILLDDGDRRCLQQYDLTPVQFYALHWSNSADGKTLGEVSERLLCTPSNVTRVVDILVRRGLLCRERDSEDRRVVRVYRTPAGQKLYEEVSRTYVESIRERIGTLSESEHATLQELLGPLKNSLKSRRTELSSVC